jgi:hypothetical protein
LVIAPHYGKEGMTMTTTTTTTQETVAEATREAIGNVVHIWADSLEKFVGWMPTPDDKGVPTAKEVVDDLFNFYFHALATQRECTESLLAAAKSVTTNAAWAARGAVKKKS